MRTVHCDHCGLSAPSPGLARIDDWSSVRMTIRQKIPGSNYSRTIEVPQYELCPDCTADITTFLSKASQ